MSLLVDEWWHFLFPDKLEIVMNQVNQKLLWMIVG